MIRINSIGRKIAGPPNGRENTDNAAKLKLGMRKSLAPVGARVQAGRSGSSTARMRRTPALEASSFWILKRPS